ncbi:Splicing factor U2af small subunit A [Galdieria sulphuraria]|uniref:Splicing factor U2AF 35 kDa subunit n=1 Tax=Galdieria sulphuraria TaxID=130081 RepID=M2XVE9_GALSU|nr:splicing factor U2AF 35 kDa subunit [Galdieria sulphuraria]EME27364.1 splicing factor U2AF 35 kDa subunit [Galdieria sulphuraria]GJD09519.1 Splicing factor U2af small subunit A [Galdieria sulphuraria]|eukprot:XP_005703884.1 splicing factor U2AF 35 kDa subunit [Galdieria sulphuraria]
MAEHLASIFGTEKDRVNCPFYFKIGACRHGERCSRLHNKPVFSQTILLKNMYLSVDQIAAAAIAVGAKPPEMSEEDIKYHFDDFYEDVYDELSKYGEIEEMHVCENMSEHLTGNVYIKFKDEDAAQRALQAVNGRYYAGRMVHAEFSPVTDFREARCRPYERQLCDRGDYCNFMHIKRISDDLFNGLFRRRRRQRELPAREPSPEELAQESLQRRRRRDSSEESREQRRRKRRESRSPERHHRRRRSSSSPRRRSSRERRSRHSSSHHRRHSRERNSRKEHDSEH